MSDPYLLEIQELRSNNVDLETKLIDVKLSLAESSQEITRLRAENERLTRERDEAMARVDREFAALSFQLNTEICAKASAERERDLAQANAEAFDKDCIDMRYQRDAAEARAEAAERKLERLTQEQIIDFTKEPPRGWAYWEKEKGIAVIGPEYEIIVRRKNKLDD